MGGIGSRTTNSVPSPTVHVHCFTVAASAECSLILIENHVIVYACNNPLYCPTPLGNRQQDGRGLHLGSGPCCCKQVVQVK